MKRLALMIGIDEYPNLKKKYHLKGCVNDQRVLYQLLTEKFEFRENNIELLLDSEATRANILEALDCLAGIGEYEGESVVDEGDMVLISYSGHGSRLKEPPDQRDEADGYDSTIVPYDSGRMPPVGLGGSNLEITDDEISLRLQKIQERADHVVLLFDCCHSGTISRDLEGGPTRRLPEDDHYNEVERLVSLAGTRSLEEKQPKGPSGWLPLNDKYILIAACRDDEVAYEYRHPQTKQACGILSYHIARELSKDQGQLTYYDLFKQVASGVTRRFAQQHPQMEGDWNRNVLSTDAIQVEPFVPVRARVDDHQVQLPVGFAHGTTIGSLWELRSANLADDKVLAEVTIQQVGALESLARSETLLPNTVGKGCRAIEVSHVLGDLRLPVAVDGMNRAKMSELRDKIEQSSLLRLAKEGPVELVAALLPPRQLVDVANESLYAPEMGSIEEPTWVIVGRDRHMLPSPPHPISEPDALEITFSNLETWARYFNIHRIQPIGADPLRNKLSISLSFADGNPLPIDEESQLPSVYDGYNIRLELTNQYSKPLYYVIFSLDAVGAVSRLWPPSHAKEPIMPYEGYPLEFPLMLPDNFPTMLNQAIETLKVMVSTQYVDFDTMVQEGSRLGEINELENLYLSASQSGQSASMTPMHHDIDEHSWTVVQLDYQIKRN